MTRLSGAQFAILVDAAHGERIGWHGDRILSRLIDAGYLLDNGFDISNNRYVLTDKGRGYVAAARDALAKGDSAALSAGERRALLEGRLFDDGLLRPLLTDRIPSVRRMAELRLDLTPADYLSIAPLSDPAERVLILGRARFFDPTPLTDAVVERYARFSDAATIGALIPALRDAGRLDAITRPAIDAWLGSPSAARAVAFLADCGVRLDPNRVDALLDAGDPQVMLALSGPTSLTMLSPGQVARLAAEGPSPCRANVATRATGLSSALVEALAEDDDPMVSAAMRRRLHGLAQAARLFDAQSLSSLPAAVARYSDWTDDVE